MNYQLNLHLKSFGLNATPHLTVCPNNENEIKNVLDGYRPVLRGYELYEFHVDVNGNTCVTTRILKESRVC